MADFLTPDQFAGRAGIYNGEIQNFESALQSVFDSIASSIREGYDSRGDTPSSALQRNLAAAEAQQKQLNTLSTFDFDAMMTDIGRQYVIAAREQQALAAKLAEDSSVSLFSDPVQAIINEFTLPWTRQELAGKNNQVATLKNQALELNSMMQNTASTYKASEQTMTAEIANDLANASRANIEERALRANAEAARLDIDKVKEAREADRYKLEMWKMASDKEYQDFQKQNSLEHLAMTRKQYEMSVERFNREREKDADEQKDKKFMVNTVNAAITKVGGTPLSEEDVGRRFRVQDPYVKMLFETGLRLRFSPDGDGSVALNPVGRLNFEEKFGLGATTVAQKELVQLNREAYKKVTDADPHLRQNPQLLADKSQEQLAKEFDEKQKKIRPLDETNPAKPVAYGTMAESEFAKTSPLWKQYVAPILAATPGKERETINFNSILSPMLADAAQGKISPSKIAEFLVDAAHVSMHQNSAENKFKFFMGFDQTRLRYEMTNSGAFSNGTTFVELTNQSEVERYVAKRIFETVRKNRPDNFNVLYNLQK